MFQFADGSLCFPGDFQGTLSWIVTCEDDSVISTTPLNYETYTAADSVIIGAVFSEMREKNNFSLGTLLGTILGTILSKME